MSTIVCATRGGEGSRSVQLRAIERAQETGERLIFLYVVNVKAVGHIDASLNDAVRAELYWLGHTILRIAKQRAEQANLDAQVVIREGEVRTEIERFLHEAGARMLLLGASRDSTIVFGDDAIERFARAIEDDTGIPVEIVRARTQKQRIQDGNE